MRISSERQSIPNSIDCALAGKVPSSLAISWRSESRKREYTRAARALGSVEMHPFFDKYSMLCFTHSRLTPIPLPLPILIDGETVKRKHQTDEHFIEKVQTSEFHELLDGEIQECYDSL